MIMIIFIIQQQQIERENSILWKSFDSKILDVFRMILVIDNLDYILYYTYNR